MAMRLPEPAVDSWILAPLAGAPTRATWRRSAAIRRGVTVRRNARSASKVATTASVSGPNTDSCCGPACRQCSKATT